MDSETSARLAAARRTLAGIEPAAVSPALLADLVARLAEVVASAHAALVRAIGVADRAGVWLPEPAEPRPRRRARESRVDLAAHARLTGTSATALRRAARVLDALPHLAEAFRRGEVSLDHVLAVTAPLTSTARVCALAGPTERELTALARRAGPAEVRAATERWLAGADPDGARRDAETARQGRALSLLPVPAGAGGRVALAGSVPLDDARTVLDALRAAADSAGPGDDGRTAAQRRADALVTLAGAYLAQHGRSAAARRVPATARREGRRRLGHHRPPAARSLHHSWA